VEWADLVVLLEQTEQMVRADNFLPPTEQMEQL
jgi:hypothetical protein